MVRDFIILLIVSALLIYAVFAIIDNARLKELEVEKYQAGKHLSAMQSSIEQRLQGNVFVLHALKPEIIWQDSPDRLRLQKVVDEFLSVDLDISHLALAPDLRVSFVYPMQNNLSVIGFDYRTSASQYHDILRAIGRQDILVSAPIDLVQGGKAIIARLPIFEPDGSLWGISSLVIHYDKFFDAIQFHRNPNYTFLLRHKQTDNQGQVIAGHESVLAHDPISTDVNVAGDTWQLLLAPRDGLWIQQHKDYIWYWLVGLGITAIFITAFSILIITQHRLHRAVYTISYQAKFDPLTDLANRQFFQHQLENEIEYSHQQDAKFALIMLDLDHLRDINDALGHDVGDAMLQHVAARITHCIGADDILARVGGDEFAILLANIADTIEVERFAKVIINDVMNTADIEQNHINITASVGISMFPEDASDAQHLIKCAELAMYSAKATGSLTVSFYDERLRQNTERHIALHHQIINALNEQQFHVEYQPVIDSFSGELTRCEALIRWDHPERGEISPAEFIPIAEKSGAIVSLGDFVLAQVVKDWRVMRDAGLDLTIAVNRSPREFNDNNAAENWLEVLEDAGMPSDKLTLEITESMLMRNKERQLINLHRLRAAGVHLAIDDFGTGYSSLNYLRSYPIDIIKIDRDFLKDVPQNKQQNALVEVLLRIAHTLDMEVVAEGVETIAQVDFLQKRNCHYQQGFYHGRSMRLKTFVEFTKRFNEKVRVSR